MTSSVHRLHRLGAPVYNQSRTPTTMFWNKKKADKGRYYLLPGQGRGARKKHRQQLWLALSVGVVAAALIGTLIWAMNHKW